MTPLTTALATRIGLAMRRRSLTVREVSEELGVS